MSDLIDEYKSLEKNIYQYKRKHLINSLVNKLLWGVFYISILLGLLLLFEYFLYLKPFIKTSALALTLVAIVFYLSLYIIYPGLQLFQLIKGKNLSALVSDISKHMPDIKDSLINTIQLNEQYKKSSSSLLLASIVQKSEGLNLFSFENSINIKDNFYRSKWRIGPIVLLLLIALFFPAIFKESSSRLMNYNNVYIPPAPFKFNLNEPVSQVLEHEDINIDLNISGNEIPRSPEIVVNGLTYKLNSVGYASFKFKIRNVQNDINFFFQAQNHKSKTYHVSLLPKPDIQNIEILCQYPEYLKLEDKTYNELQDLTVNEGTNISWKFKTNNTSTIELVFNDTILDLEKDADLFYNKRVFFGSKRYAFISKNAYTINHIDSAFFNVNVTPDLHPKIFVESKKDSNSPSQILFIGKVEDDHGLKKLSFWFSSNNNGPFKQKQIKLGSNSIQDFYYFTDLDSLGLDQIFYFFSITDNDAINGFKTTKTPIYNFRSLDKAVIDKLKKDKNNALKEQMASLMSNSNKKLKELERLKNKLQQKKSLTWQEQKQIKELMKEQDILINEFNELKEEQKKRLDSPLFNESLSNELLEKQKKLQELFDELVPDDLKKLMDELEKELDELSKDKSMEMLEKMSMTNEELNNELDRMMELFKQFEFEVKMDEVINEIDDLKKKQLKEAAETKDKGNDLDKQKKNQDNLNDAFKDIRKDFDEMERLNNELENKNKILETDSLEKVVEEMMKEGSENLEKGKRNKGSDSQKKAGDKMQELQEMVQDMKDQIMKDNISVDMAMLEKLLNNLINISFAQEDMIKKSKGINPKGNKYKSYIQEQFKISEDLEIIEDSLHALSKRVMQLESFVMKELSSVKKNLKKSINNLTNRQVSKAKVNQQYSMTSLNNLALMLSESLEQMQSQMAAGMKGCQNCQKKKGNKSGPKSIGDMQKQLGEQLKKLKEGKGKGLGEKGHKQWNKSLAQMAIKQAKIREQLRALNQSKNKDGEKKYGDLEKIMEEMEQNVKDIVNNNLTEELLKRHNEITTRLLSVEKAIREQDLSDERKAESALNYTKSKPGLFEEYLRIKKEQIELYQTVPAELKPFYKNLVNKYYKQLNN